MSPTDALIGVVTFDPNIELLTSCLRAATEQSQHVLVYDNGSANVDEVRDVCAAVGAELVLGEENRGIAVGLNQVVSIAAARGLSFVLLLDQDSILKRGSLMSLVSASSDPRTALVGSMIVDRGSGSVSGGSAKVNYVITSGSLLRIAAWTECGGFDENYFIDFVDFDLCARLRLLGYEIWRVDQSGISHAVGHSRHRTFGTVYGYSPFRLRHMAADMIRFARKHQRTPIELRPPRTSRIMVLAVLARKALLIIVYERQKAQKVRAIASGAWAGLTQPLADVARGREGGVPA